MYSWSPLYGHPPLAIPLPLDPTPPRFDEHSDAAKIPMNTLLLPRADVWMNMAWRVDEHAAAKSNSLANNSLANNSLATIHRTTRTLRVGQHARQFIGQHARRANPPIHARTRMYNVRILQAQRQHLSHTPGSGVYRQADLPQCCFAFSLSLSLTHSFSLSLTQLFSLTLTLTPPPTAIVSGSTDSTREVLAAYQAGTPLPL